MRNAAVEDGEGGPVGQRIERAGAQGGDVDDQCPVRPPFADRPPAHDSEEADGDEYRRGAGDQRPVVHAEKRRVGGLRRMGVDRPRVAAQTGLHVDQCGHREGDERQRGTCPSKPTKLPWGGGLRLRYDVGQRLGEVIVGPPELSGVGYLMFDPQVNSSASRWSRVCAARCCPTNGRAEVGQRSREVDSRLDHFVPRRTKVRLESVPMTAATFARWSSDGSFPDAYSC